MSSTCQEAVFPITVGGNKDERTTCVLHDEVNNLIIVAGNTTSDDFAPAANDHGFVYAVDFSGNWVWGKFYYNQSYAVQTISGCQLDAKNRLIIYGMCNSMPIILDLDPLTGNVG